MAFQFVHMECYSRKGDGKGRDVDFVLAEARRYPFACAHVDQPRPPTAIFGDIDEVERRHDVGVEIGRTTPKGGKPRRIRKDRHTLATVVLSHPFTPEEVWADPAKRTQVEAWEHRSLAWLREQFGECLVSVIRHEDEGRWHLHAYAVPTTPEMKACDLHPGRKAKADIMAAGALPGEDNKALNRRGDAAYRSAMRQWQDHYFDRVGAVSGLSRLGPGRRRLTRDEWQAERVQADALRRSLARAERVQTEGREYVSKVQQRAAAEKAEAAAAIHDARRERDMASRAVSEAARVHREAMVALGSAERARGLGGLLRGFWDGVRFSKLRAAVAAEFSARLGQAQKLLDQAHADVRTERDRRRDVERKVTSYATALQDLTGQRDQARMEAMRLRKLLEPTSTKIMRKGYRP